MARKRGFAWLLFFVTVLLAGAAFWNHPAKPAIRPHGVWVGSGGQRLEFVQAGLRRTPVAPRKSIRPQLLKMFPAEWLGPDTPPGPIALDNHYDKAEPPPLLLTFELTAANRGLPALHTFVPQVEIVESTGYVFKYPHAGRSGNGASVMLMCESFPRRDENLLIRTFEQDQSRVLFEFTIPNPAFDRTFPTWLTEPLPIRRISGPIAASFRGLQFDADLGEVHPVLEVTPLSPEWNRFRVDELFLEDATGNSRRLPRDVRPFPSPYEPAWKFRCRISRQDDSAFDPSEVWTSPEWKLPLEGARTAIGLNVEAAGVPIVIREQVNLGPLNIQNDENSPAAAVLEGRTFFVVRFGERPPETVALVQVIDQDGRNLGSTHLGFRREPSLDRRINFVASPETKSVRLRLIAHRTISFEFVFQPPPALRDRL